MKQYLLTFILIFSILVNGLFADDSYVASFNKNGELTIYNSMKEVIDPMLLNNKNYILMSEQDFTECIKAQRKLKKAKQVTTTIIKYRTRTITKEDDYKVIKYMLTFVVGLSVGILTYKVVK